MRLNNHLTYQASFLNLPISMSWDFGRVLFYALFLFKDEPFRYRPIYEVFITGTPFHCASVLTEGRMEANYSHNSINLT